jgi:hypothetical protein
MMQEMGAVEVTDEMIQKSLTEGRKKKAENAAKTEAIMSERNKGAAETLQEGGLDLTDAQQERMRESPDKIQEAKDEAIASATQLAMYQHVRCEGCSVVAECLGTDLQAAWKKGWKKDSVLSYVQSFCESKALPGGYQVVAMAPEVDSPEHVYIVEKFDGVIATTPHSLETIRRICREQVDDLDGEIAKQAVKLTEVAHSSDKYSAQHHVEIFQRGFNYTLCTTPCGGKKTKEGRKRADKGLRVEL